MDATGGGVVMLAEVLCMMTGGVLVAWTCAIGCSFSAGSSGLMASIADGYVSIECVLRCVV